MYFLTSVPHWGRGCLIRILVFFDIETLPVCECLCSRSFVADVSFSIFKEISPLFLSNHFHLSFHGVFESFCFVLCFYFIFFRVNFFCYHYL